MDKKDGKDGKTAWNNLLDPWRFICEWKTEIVDGVEYDWCPFHGHKDEDGKQGGMYMHAPHDHDEWLKKREEKRAARNLGKKSADKKSDGNGKPKAAEKKLTLAKSMKSILAPQAGFSDAEAAHLIAAAEESMAGKD